MGQEVGRLHRRHRRRRHHRRRLGQELVHHRRLHRRLHRRRLGQELVQKRARCYHCQEEVERARYHRWMVDFRCRGRERAVQWNRVGNR